LNDTTGGGPRVTDVKDDKVTANALSRSESSFPNLVSRPSFVLSFPGLIISCELVITAIGIGTALMHNLNLVEISVLLEDCHLRGIGLCGVIETHAIRLCIVFRKDLSALMRPTIHH
jgi:hypothetical protein